jgi:hypothetical protein
MHVMRDKHCASLLVLKNKAKLKKRLFSHLLKEKARKSAAHTKIHHQSCLGLVPRNQKAIQSVYNQLLLLLVVRSKVQQ